MQRIWAIAVLCALFLILPCRAQRGASGGGFGRGAPHGPSGLRHGASIGAHSGLRGGPGRVAGFSTGGIPFVSAGRVAPGGGFRRISAFGFGRHGTVVIVSFSPFFQGLFDPFLFFHPFIPGFFNPVFIGPFQPFFFPKHPFICQFCRTGFAGFGFFPLGFSPDFLPFTSGELPLGTSLPEDFDLGQQDQQNTPSPEGQTQSEPEQRAAESTLERAPWELPPTVLMFRDYRWIEVKSYTVVGDFLYEYDPHWIRKIRLSDLDLPETIRLNAERGIQFRVPADTKDNSSDHPGRTQYGPN